MLIPLDTLIEDFDLRIDGVLHLGAHTGEEAQAYAENDVGDVYWVEGNPKLMPYLKRHIRSFPGQFAYQALVADEGGKEITFHISSNDTTRHRERGPPVLQHPGAGYPPPVVAGCLLQRGHHPRVNDR